MTTSEIIKKIKESARNFSSVKLFFFCLLWLMILLTIGTIAQKNIGLYQSQQLYFSSWIYWLGGFVPVPGGQITIGLIFLGLLSKLLFQTTFKFKTMGISITHLGALLLILGGIITGYFMYEGSMVIREGETVDFFQDFHKLEVAVFDPAPVDHDKVIAFGEGFIEEGEILKSSEFPFKIKILKFCRNCRYEKNSVNVKSKDKYQGFTKNFTLMAAPLAIEDAENRSGILFEVEGSDADGIYGVFEHMQIAQSIMANGKKYYIQIRHKRYSLPFKLELIDFDKTDYASTRMAKSYKSVVYLIDDTIKQRTIIQMNEPLRYKGYTLYQSSYIQDSGEETTVLSVVHNIGRMFPYISSIIICIGIVIHILITSNIFKGFFKKKVVVNAD